MKEEVVVVVDGEEVIVKGVDTMTVEVLPETMTETGVGGETAMRIVDRATERGVRIVDLATEKEVRLEVPFAAEAAPGRTLRLVTAPGPHQDAMTTEEEVEGTMTTEAEEGTMTGAPMIGDLMTGARRLHHPTMIATEAIEPTIAQGIATVVIAAMAALRRIVQEMISSWLNLLHALTWHPSLQQVHSFIFNGLSHVLSNPCSNL